jgi:antitoxin component YwqK of YwqJK toxin-antitoxin module
MLKLVTTKKWACAALLAFSVYTPNASAQNQLPPAHTYYADANGGDSQRVKERWSEDANGQKNGAYIKYDRDGKVIAKYTYLHGVKEGPASYIDEYGTAMWHMPSRFAGVYKQGKKVGFWAIYPALGGVVVEQPGTVEEYSSAGVLLRSASMKNGNPVEIVSFNKLGERSGPVEIHTNGSEKDFASGSYLAGKPVGVWQNAALSAGGSIEYRKGYKVTFSNGTAVSVTDDHGKVTPVQELKRQQAASVASAATAKVNSQHAAEAFYTLTREEDAAFLKTSFTTDEGVKSGAELLATNYLTTDAISNLIKLNPGETEVRLILKKAYVVQGNKTPIRLLMQNTYLRDNTTLPLMKLGEPRVLGEMIYYGLRGVGTDKGIDTGFIIKDVIRRLGSWGDGKKRSIETWFNLCAQNGDLVAYRDTTKYPLRRWLYDQFKNDDPYQWMNHLTEDSYTLKRNNKIPGDAPDDEQLYPVRK